MHMSGNRRAHESNPAGTARGPKNGRGPPAPRKAPRKAARRHACFPRGEAQGGSQRLWQGARCAAGAAGLLGVLERTGVHAPLTDSAAARNPHRHGWRPGWSTDRQRPEDARTPAGRVAPAATASRGHLQRDDKLVQSKIHTRIPVSPLPCSPKRRRPTRAGGGTPGSRRQRCPPAGVLLPVSSCRSG